MSSEAALIRLARSSSEAGIGVLETFAAGQVQAGDVSVLDPGTSPPDGLPYPVVATSVAYPDDEPGAGVFVMTLAGARRLAAAMMGASDSGSEPAADGATELTELELSTVTTAMHQVVAAGGAALSAVLGTEVELGPPETRTFLAELDAEGAYPTLPHAVRAAFSIFGEPCRLVHLVPGAFVARADRALGAETASEAAAGAPFGAAAGAPSLAGIHVRVWAELGRASMSTAAVVGLPTGAVVELDRSPDEPIDLFVNGRRFATGRLVVVDGNDWAVRIERVLDPSGDADAGDGAEGVSPQQTSSPS